MIKRASRRHSGRWQGRRGRENTRLWCSGFLDPRPRWRVPLPGRWHFQFTHERPILARHIEIDGPPRLCVRQGIPPTRPHSARSREPRHRSRHRRLCAGSIRARRQPFRASPSVGGVACGHTNGSRHWVSASRPPAAVTAGGHPVSRGRRSLPGQRQRAAQAGLASMLGRGEDRVRGDLRAGAGRRGDRDERRLRFGDRQPSAADARAFDLALIDRGLPGHGRPGRHRQASPEVAVADTATRG